MSPQRIQRKRTKGWRMPENAVSVCRPGKWGNPWRVSEYVTAKVAVEGFRRAIERGGYQKDPDDREWHPMPTPEAIRAALAGKNLACWCPLDQPCHADVLLELANK
jgi:hypothetical protein